MKRILMVGVLSALALFSAPSFARSTACTGPVFLPAAIYEVTAVDSFAQAVVDLAREVARLSVLQPPPVADTAIAAYHEEIFARHKAYMAAGGQLIAPRDRADIGPRKRT